jgi:hypothetical protein
MSLFYSGYPLLNDHLWGKVELFDSLEEAVRCDNSDSILILRYFRYEENLDCERGVEVDKLTPVREKYSNIIFFDDADGAGDTRFEVLPFVDKYLKKQIFSSFEDYQRRLYGRQLFTDYYHKEYDVEDGERFTRLPLSSEVDASKIVLAWNLGAGAYPIHPLCQKMGVTLSHLFGKKAVLWRYSAPPIRSNQSKPQKTPFVHAHFSPGKGRPTVDFQREMFLEIIEGEDLFRCGRVSKRTFDRNMSKAMIALSPFGWGEVCFRDFEAILHGAALMKPDMSHIDTWPDIYEPFETYIPVGWDGNDIVPKARKYLSRPKECSRIANNAREQWLRSCSQMEDRVRQILGDV